jgi:O-antigen/teichoic acid export membrane protein
VNDTPPRNPETPISEAPKSAIPEGTVPVGVGLLIAGIASYAFFKVGQEALGREDFKPIVALWFAVFALAPGFFMPIEQEVGRALAHRRALGQGGAPVVRKVIPLAMGFTLIVSLIVLAGSSWLTREFFEGYGIITVALILAFVAYAPTHLARGICSGSGRFVDYGIVMGMDGLARIVGCVVLWIVGSHVVGAYAMVVVLAPLVGVSIVLFRGGLRTQDGPPATWAEITPNLGWLLAGSVFAAALVNAGPIGVDVLADASQAEMVTKFGNGVLLARVPLFLFQAVQAALLPRLARLAAHGDLTEFRIAFRHLMVTVIGVGVLGVAGAATLGPWALDVVYDGGIDRRTLTLLALGSALYMLALATAQAVIALHGHKWVALGWAGAMVSFVLVTWLSTDDLYLRVELASVVSSAIALAVFAVALRRRMASGDTPDVESMIEALSERPLEG